MAVTLLGNQASVLPNNQPNVQPVYPQQGYNPQPGPVLLGNAGVTANVADSLNQRATEIQNQLSNYNNLQTQLRSLGNNPNPRAIESIQTQIAGINPGILSQELQDISNRQAYLQSQAQQVQSQAPQMNNRPSADVANILGANLAQPVQQPQPSQNANQFPTVSEQYKQLAEQAKQKGNLEEANRLTLLANDNDIFSQFRNKTTDLLNTASNIIDPVNREYAGVMSAVDADIKGKLGEAKNIFESQYGPSGAQTKRLESLYSDLGNYITNNFAEEQALQQSLGTKSGATPSQQIATRNKVANDQLEQIAKIKQDEVKQYEGLYNNYNALLNNFIQQYGGSTDKNVVQTYKDIFNIKQALNSQWIEANRAFLNSEFSNSLNRQNNPNPTTTTIETDAQKKANQTINNLPEGAIAQKKDGTYEWAAGYGPSQTPTQ